MSRYIDADALYRSVMKKVCDDCPYDDDMECDGDDCKAGMMLRMIDDAPTVNAVQIVLCKDCKHFKKPLSPDMWGWCKKVSMDNKATVEDWFCADGERKE